MRMRDTEKGQVLIFAATIFLIFFCVVCLFFQPKKIESIDAFVLIAAGLVFPVTLIPGFPCNADSRFCKQSFAAKTDLQLC